MTEETEPEPILKNLRSRSQISFNLPEPYRIFLTGAAPNPAGSETLGAPIPIPGKGKEGTISLFNCFICSCKKKKYSNQATGFVPGFKLPSHMFTRLG